MRIASALAFVVAIAAAAQAPAPKLEVPEWAQPGTATRTQVAPPPHFHRPSKTINTPIGIFDGQTEIGSPLVEGSATYNAAAKEYTINSAGYNIWYTRDEFRFLWKRMSGDASLAADIRFPDAHGYGDRKAVLMIRQDLEDDSKTVVAALHGAGMIQLGMRAGKNTRMKDIEFRVGSRGGRPGGNSPDSLVGIVAKRIGLEKRGKAFALYVSIDDEPMHQFGAPIQVDITGPYYVGIGLCAHLPDQLDTAILSNVVLANASGTVR